MIKLFFKEKLTQGDLLIGTIVTLPSLCKMLQGITPFTHRLDNITQS